MKTKKRNKNVYRIRRAILKAYICLSFIIGFPMAIIGTGGDYGEFVPELYIPGMILLSTGLALMYIIHEIIREYDINEF